MGDPSSYEFLYRSSPASECQGGNPEEDKATPAAASTGATPEPVEAEVKELLAVTNYTFCLRTENQAGETALGAPVTFTTPTTAPTVVGEAASSVESSDATLEAEVRPNGLETTYRFEYGTTDTYGTSTPEGTLEGLTGISTGRTHITGLTPNTTYHYRVITSNSLGPVERHAGPRQNLHHPDRSRLRTIPELLQRKAARGTALWPETPRLPGI